MLQYTFYHNALHYWIYAIAVFFGVYLLERITKAVILRQLRKIDHVESIARNGWNRAVEEMFGSIHWSFLLLIAFYVGSRLLTLPEIVNLILAKIVFIASLLQLGCICRKKQRRSERFEKSFYIPLIASHSIQPGLA